MTEIRFVGDVHGKIPEYLEKIKSAEASIQVGDMGLGFRGVQHVPKLRAGHFFLRGNHDDPARHYKHPSFIGDFGIWEKPRLFYLSGAFSIDCKFRIPEVSWWENEELDIEALARAEMIYKTRKPDYVVTHDCPDSIRQYLLNQILMGRFRPEKDLPSRTSAALERMFQAHQPKIWIFGHYHVDRDFVYEGTRFICLNELSTIDLELS